VQSAIKEAQSVIEREQVIHLSRRDCERLLDLLENPPKPNARFVAAMQYYEQTQSADADSIHIKETPCRSRKIPR
jgi:uncharacterized protein (DUF1778 family)